VPTRYARPTHTRPARTWAGRRETLLCHSVSSQPLDLDLTPATPIRDSNRRTFIRKGDFRLFEKLDADNSDSVSLEEWHGWLTRTKESKGLKGMRWLSAMLATLGKNLDDLAESSQEDRRSTLTAASASGKERRARWQAGGYILYPTKCVYSAMDPVVCIVRIVHHIVEYIVHGSCEDNLASCRPQK